MNATPLVAHFTIAYWCVLAAALLPIVCAGIAKGGGGGFDNGAPRAWLRRQDGWRARADAAQANGFENLAFFIGAVVIAHQLGAPQDRVDLLAVGYIAARGVYSALYIGDRPTLRSVAYMAGFVLNVALLFAGWR